MIQEKSINARVGIVGLGAVGSAVEHAMSFFHSCAGYDIKGIGSWNEILKTSAVFVCVQTPEGADGRLDCSAVESVLSRLDGDGYPGICVIKSTVGIGFTDSVVRRFPQLRIVYNPEFIREKSNFTWFVNPDRIVISGNESDFDEVLQLFTWVDGLNESVPVLTMSHRDAEIGKLAHNAYIATKVSFTNEMDQICREHGADPDHVMSVIHADRRVKTSEHLRPGLGAYGGKCVPKDTRELINASHNTSLLKAVENVNETTQKRSASTRTRSAAQQPAESRSL